MVLVTKTYRDVILDELDAIEQSAAHVTRTFERVEPAAGDEDRVFAWLQPVLEVGVLGGLQQRLADRRDAHQPDMHVDERARRIARNRPLGRARVGHIGKCAIDLADIQREPP